MAPRKVIIGDVHGCPKTLDSLLAQLDLSSGDQLFFLGDYVDRGPDSKGVIDRIRKLAEAPFQVVSLRGNHEQMLINNYETEAAKGWQSNAPEELLQSFGIENLRELPVDYYNWCLNRPLYYRDEELFLVHAGVNFHSADPLEDEKGLLWIRDWYQDVNLPWLEGRTLVHGHTPIPRLEIERQFSSLDRFPVLNIDGGACFHQSRAIGYAYLCAYDHTLNQLFFAENIDVILSWQFLITE